jgi:hypothetical protein
VPVSREDQRSWRTGGEKDAAMIKSPMQRRPGCSSAPAAVANLSRRCPGDIIEAALVGYAGSPTTERAAFWMSSSFATTIASSRILNYVRERRRPLPVVRGAARRLEEFRAGSGLTVHHFLPGIGLGLTSGATAILCSSEPSIRFLSIPLGIGLALTADELFLLLGRNNAYWGSERFAFLQTGAAYALSVVFVVDFIRRGRATPSKDSCGGSADDQVGSLPSGRQREQKA